MKQSLHDRIERLNKGCCPVHGSWMSQVDGWYKTDDGKSFTVVGCSRQACLIFAKAYSIDGPWELPDKFQPLLNDSFPDPRYIDENVKPLKRKRSLKRFKSQVWDKTKGYCYYCGVLLNIDDMTIDHLVPEHAGGASEIKNLVPACKSCNSSKGTKSVEEFRFSMSMKMFYQEHGLTFSQEQVDFLAARNVDLGIPNYQFWFEHNEIQSEFQG